MKNYLYEIVINYESKIGKIFAFFVQFLIVLSVIGFSLETLPNLDENEKLILNISETVITIFFTIEYMLRIYLSKSSLKYIFSFYGLIDLIAILPFYMSTGIDLRSIRILRLLRLFRILKIFRYNRAIKNLKESVIMIKEELIIFSIISLMVIYLSSVGIYFFENEEQPEVFKSIFHSMWWAVATLTTVGYGDIYPVTIGGKIFTFIVLIVGIGIVAIPAGLFASSLTKNKSDE